MSVVFSRSLRSLSVSRSRGATIGIVFIALVLSGWAVWALRARISLYESTSAARIEVESDAHPIETQISGRVVKSYLKLGQQVRAGQVLLELDAESERLQLAEQQTQPRVLESQLAALRTEAEGARRALDQARETAHAAVDESRAQLRQAEGTARFAQLEVNRMAPLRASGVISEMEFLRLKSEAEKSDAAVDSARLGIARLEKEHSTSERDRQTQIERLEGEISHVQTQMLTENASVRKLAHEIDKRRILAPVSGQIGETVEPRPGTFVTAGARLGSIIPDGGLKIVARFSPQAALGRIQPGQTALLKLDAFPWSQYGSVAAKVVTVAREVEDGQVRVDLEVSPSQTNIPLQHGLTGTVEIEVKRVSPLTLVVQYLGRSLAAAPPQTG
jgi:membrane fusion protein (multidrug efflux system)